VTSGGAGGPSGGGAGAENSVLDLQEAITRLVTPFLTQGGPVFVGRCCNFLYAGERAADRCGACKKPVACLKVTSTEEARAWASQPRP
jgi:hypothetical protein